MRYIVRRVGAFAALLIGLSIAGFGLQLLAPGDPAYFALANEGLSEPTEAELDFMRQELGLNRAVHVQYLSWLASAMQGDFGRSYRTGRPIAAEMSARFPVTLQLSLASLLTAAFFGIVLGTPAAVLRGGWTDSLVDAFSSVLIAVPGFIIAVASITFIAESVPWFPVAGRGSVRHFILPTLALSSGTLGVTIRLVRVSVMEELERLYVTFADSKGNLPVRTVLLHVLPNALPGVFTFLANAFATIAGGALIVETVFALPGIGRYAIEGVLNRDIPIVQAYVVLTGLLYLSAQLAVDLLLVALDPRVRNG